MGEPGDVEGTGFAGVFSIQFSVFRFQLSGFRGRMGEPGEVSFALYGPGGATNR